MRVSRAAARRFAWVTWLATLAMAITHLTLDAQTDPRLADELTPAFVLAWASALVAFQSFATVGAVLVSRLPENPIGWLFCSSALLCQFSNASGAYISFAFEHSLPGDLATSVVASPSWFVGAYLGVFMPLYVFPNGRPLTPRWRPVYRVALGWILLLWVSVMITPGRLDLHPTRRNPIGVEVLGDGLGVVVGLVLPLILLAVVSVVLRYRRSRGEERQQLRVFAFTTLGVLCAFLVLAVTPEERLLGPFGEALVLVLIALVPISMGVAVMRYRLYDLDRIVSRTLVYAAVSAFLGAAYGGLVLAGQALFSSFAGGSNLAIAASTLVVAALFLPVRSRVQHFVDRRFYRRRYDAQRTLEGFGARLREQVELVALERDLQSVVTETMQPVHTSVWLREGGR